MDKMNCFGDEKEKVDDDSRDNTMFRNMKIPDTLEFTEPFDTSKTDAISSMFQDIRVPAPEEIGIPLKEILRETQDGLMHYEGELGVFDYNPEEFEVIYIDGGDALHYIGYHAVRLPEGCINTRYMFAQDYLPEGFLGWWFDTSSVVNMEHASPVLILSSVCTFPGVDSVTAINAFWQYCQFSFRQDVGVF